MSNSSNKLVLIWVIMLVIIVLACCVIWWMMRETEIALHCNLSSITQTQLTAATNNGEILIVAVKCPQIFMNNFRINFDNIKTKIVFGSREAVSIIPTTVQGFDLMITPHGNDGVVFGIAATKSLNTFSLSELQQFPEIITLKFKTFQGSKSQLATYAMFNLQGVPINTPETEIIKNIPFDIIVNTVA